MPPFTPILRPRSYFAEREISFFRVMAVFAVLLFTGPMTIYGVGWVMTSHIDGTVTVENPERPPDWFCEDNDGCEEPERIDRDVDTVIWDQLDRLLGPSFIVYPFVLGILTVLLHGGAWLVGSDTGWFPSFGIAAWGLLPSVLIVGVSLVGLWQTVDPVTIGAGDDIETALAPLEAQMRSFDRYRTLGTALESIWGGLIWRAGLREHHDLPNTEASVVAGIVAVLLIAGTLLL